MMVIVAILESYIISRDPNPAIWSYLLQPQCGLGSLGQFGLSLKNRCETSVAAEAA